MSGLCGLVRFDGGVAEPSVLESMASAAAHRGPDGIGRWCSGGVGVVHLALHGTPESAREGQPLVGGEGEHVLVADARIDNRDELAAALGGEAGATDAELILRAYRRWGTECAARLIGDFAFAIWDAGERRLFAARDPLGMRAFYYRVEPERVVFATEVKQLLEVPGVPVRLFEPAVGAYLAGVFGPPEWTFYEGIAQLAPAHALVVGPEGHRSWRYWDIDPGHRIRYAREEEYAEHFRELFVEAVRARLRSTRPVGVLLSGGLDSGSIAATAGWLAERGRVAVPELRAYSFAWEELPECDERHISDLTARRYGLEVTEVPADSAWPLAEYPDHGPDRDEPFIGVYQVLLERAYALARADGVRLVLSGDRGDELVGDWVYDFAGLARAGRWRALREEIAARRGQVGVGGLVRDVGGRRTDVRSRTAAWIRPEFSERVGLPEIVLRSAVSAPVRGAARRRRYGRVFRFGGARWATWLNRTQAKAFLEGADPWADRRLAEFILAIPQHLVHRVSERKRLARHAMADVMPPAALQAARKSEFVDLFDRGFRERGTGTVHELLSDSRIEARGFVDTSALLAEYDAFRAGTVPRHDFWPALTLEMWLRTHGPGEGR